MRAIGNRIGRRGAPAPWIVAGLAAVAMTGCYWLRYGALMETHVELLETMARDGRDAVVVRVAPPVAADITRLSYPLERAREFAEISERFHAERTSLARFRDLLERYGELVTLLDSLRGPAVRLDEERLAEVGRVAAAVEAAAAAVRDALAVE